MTDDICGSTDTESGDPCQTPAHLCQWHNSDTEGPDNGRPSKFGDTRDDLLNAADSCKNIKQVANAGGVGESTLYEYLNSHPDFSESFKRARARAADRLIERGLDPEDEVDMSFVRFLLERSFQFVKTERKEISGPDGNPIPTAQVPTDDQLDTILSEMEGAV